jgi:proteic killer suppression protein
MIKSFRHKGLQEFYETGNKRGINPDHASRLARIMDRLDAYRVKGKEHGLSG